MAARNQKGTLAGDLGAFLASGVGSDVTLVAGGTCLRAHRAVLMSRSATFRTILSEGKLKAGNDRVVVDDLGPDTLRQLLTFIYSDETPQLESAAAQLLPAADRYGLPLLKNRCARQLARALSVETAAATAVLAVDNGCDDLSAAAVAFIREHALEVMFTHGWAEALHSHPQTVAKISRLATAGPSAQSKIVTDEEAQELGWELYEAAAAGDLGKMKKLMAAGADIETGDEDSDSPLFMAASEGHVEAARLLVQAGAQVNRRNYYKQTPMHKAAERGRAGVIRLLAAAAAAADVEDEAGDTPLHLCAKYGHAEAAEALLEAGAAASARNAAQETPLDVARKEGKQHLFAILREPSLQVIWTDPWM